jgi:hypothetical protein
MKFMLSFRAAAALVPDRGKSAARMALEALRNQQDAGIIEACYVLVSGGLVFIVRAESRNELLAALRTSSILHCASPDIVELEDAPA